MHRQGRGGEALGISLVSGLVGGLFGLVVLVVATGPLARFALSFTPPAYFALGVLGLSVIAGLSGKSLLKGLIAGIIGFMIATIGTDPSRRRGGSPSARPTSSAAFARSSVVGLFAVTELMVQAIEPAWARSTRAARLKLPDWRTAALFRPQAIGAAIGTFEGVTPGAGGTIAAFLSYNEARRWSKHPEEFGQGSVEGVAAPECANNVVTGTALVPLLGLGIPGSNSAAILLGGFLLHGLAPGPLLFEKSPEVVYGLYAGLLVANVAMLLLGLVILTPCLWLVNRPKPYLMAFVLALVVSGIYAWRRARSSCSAPACRHALRCSACRAGPRRRAQLHGRVELSPRAVLGGDRSSCRTRSHRAAHRRGGGRGCRAPRGQARGKAVSPGHAPSVAERSPSPSTRRGRSRGRPRFAPRSSRCWWTWRGCASRRAAPTTCAPRLRAGKPMAHRPRSGTRACSTPRAPRA
jgi:hypothetical protein